MHIVVCDLCKREGTENFFFPTGTQTDAAGGPSEEVGPSLDLCQRHTSAVANILLRKSTYEDNAEVLKLLGAKGKK